MDKVNTICSWILHEFIHWPEPYLLLSTTCDDFWMTNCLVSGSNSNTMYLRSFENLQGMTTNVGLLLSVGDTTPQLTVSIKQDKLELVTPNTIVSAVGLGEIDGKSLQIMCNYIFLGDFLFYLTPNLYSKASNQSIGCHLRCINNMIIKGQDFVLDG